MGRDSLLILIRSSTRQKVYFTFRLLLVIALLSLVFIQLSGLFKGYTLSSGGWLKDDNPSGNYLRVERIKGSNQSKTEKGQSKQGTEHKDFYDHTR